MLIWLVAKQHSTQQASKLSPSIAISKRLNILFGSGFRWAGIIDETLYWGDV